MKISEIFNLNKTQHELDFVDIDPTQDKAVFIDPFFLSTREQPWCVDVTRTIRSFFQLAIGLINSGKEEEARSIFIHLNEPNETCLGFSRGIPRGNGIGPDDSERIFESFLKSNAVQTGLVENLEDTAIFIEGIDKDKVSDMTTNLIRRHLIEYTQNQCRLWNITLTEEVPSGFYWDATQGKWFQKHTDRLVVDDKPILLVPKIAVSFYKNYIAPKYYQHFVLNYLQGEHLLNKSHLVRERKLKSGKVNQYVTKNDIKEYEAPYSKEFLRDFSERHPDIMTNFRKKTSSTVKPIENQQLEEINLNELIDHLINELNSIEAGYERAHEFHKLIVGILELIFFPNLTNPVKEREINQGRKRIDITFDNSAKDGFFHKLHDVNKITSRYIFNECKNYSQDPANPEIDQLSGRFSANTGNFGFLVCRKITNKKLTVERTRDLYKQKNEVVLVLEDREIIEILTKIKEGFDHPEEIMLTNKIREVILG